MPRGRRSSKRTRNVASNEDDSAAEDHKDRDCHGEDAAPTDGEIDREATEQPPNAHDNVVSDDTDASDAETSSSKRPKPTPVTEESKEEKDAADAQDGSPSTASDGANEHGDDEAPEGDGAMDGSGEDKDAQVCKETQTEAAANPEHDDKDSEVETPSKEVMDPESVEENPPGSGDGGSSEDADEMWELTKVLSFEELSREGTIKCSTEDCLNAAACVWVSNLKPKSRWFSCIDCQANDFDGWPTPEEMPIKEMTSEHQAILAKKCSRQRSPAMPAIGIIQSSNQGDTPTPASKRSMAAKVTPVPAKPSASALAMHRKWQEAAEAMGGPDARIVVSKPAAKKLVFDMLQDAFRPMNITMIHKELKAVVPSPVLKSSLEDMILDSSRSGNPFDGDDDDDDAGKGCSKIAKGDSYAASLLFKAGRNASSSLYYTDHRKLKNNGNGLLPDQRNTLLGDLQSANAVASDLSRSLSSVEEETAQLLSEPTNEDLQSGLSQIEKVVGNLTEEVTEKQKLKVNEQHKKRVTRHIEGMAAQWRKRRRLCMDFLIAMEETSDGNVTVKKCLRGDGQIDIDSDENACADAKAFAANMSKRKKTTNTSTTIRRSNQGRAKTDRGGVSGLVPDASFVGVKLNSQGVVIREYL